MKFVETENTELKKSTAQLKEGIISIASILNKHGKGELYFGIKNDGTIIGQDVSEKTLRIRWSDLTFREQQIILLILHNPKIPRTAMAQFLKINLSAVQKHLEKLKNKNIIKRTGFAKGGFREIIEI